MVASKSLARRRARLIQPNVRSTTQRFGNTMIRIAISESAFEAIASTMPLGSVGYEAEVGANGERLIWIERFWRVSWSG